MIIGDGMIAKYCRSIDSDDVVFFASGVSNSKETNPEEFKRERSLLEKTLFEHKNKIIVYFSTIFNDDTAYIKHKKEMCEIVRKRKHIILNLPQVVGIGGNKNNLFNYLRSALKGGELIKVYSNAERAFIDIEDLVFILQGLIKSQHFGTHDFSYIEKLKVIDIVKLMSREIGVKPNIELLPGGSVIPGHTEIKTAKGYMEKVIKKYI